MALNGIMLSVAFFISPEGDILPVTGSHIGTVIADAERFGLTIEKIKARYEHYGECLGTEQKARKEILLHLVSRGWIRLRRYPNRYWSATVDTLSENTMNRLHNWAVRVLLGIDEVREDDRYMPVKITELNGTTNSEYTVNDLASRVVDDIFSQIKATLSRAGL